MKTLALISSLILTPLALAHPGGHDPATPDHPSDHPDHPSDHPDHPASDDAATSDVTAEIQALLTKVHDAYKNADAIVETVTLIMPSMMPGADSETMEIKTALSASHGQITVQDEMTATWVGGILFLTLEGMEGYVEREASSFAQGLEEASGGQGMPGLWTLALRDSNTPEDWVSAFSMGMPGAELIGLNATTQSDGTEVEVISLKTMMGSIDVAVTSDYQVNSVIMTIEQPGMDAMELKMSADVAFVKDIPVVAFEAGDRQKYATIDELFGDAEDFSDEGPEEKSLKGKPAPDFTLASMDGSGDVTLSSLKGEVVVLDFWECMGTWR